MLEVLKVAILLMALVLKDGWLLEVVELSETLRGGSF